MFWSSDDLIHNIVDYGVMFVPIGCKGSINEDLEWRISFSIPEKLLAYSFIHVQFLCYAFLKVVLNDFIKVKHGDILCSYF